MLSNPIHSFPIVHVYRKNHRATYVCETVICDEEKHLFTAIDLEEQTVKSHYYSSPEEALGEKWETKYLIMVDYTELRFELSHIKNEMVYEVGNLDKIMRILGV